MVTSDLASGDFRVLAPEEYDLGKTLKKHGGVLPLTAEEYERLVSRYGVERQAQETG